MEALGGRPRPNVRRKELSRSHSTDCLGDFFMERHIYVDRIISETVAQCEHDPSLLSTPLLMGI